MAKDKEVKSGGVSKVKLAVGAASLFLFVVGVKRTFRTDEGQEYRQSDADQMDRPAPESTPTAGRTRFS